MIPRKIIFWSVTAVGFLILCLLGTWQVYRLQWKNDLIAVKKKSLTADPMSLESVLKKIQANKEIEFNRIQLKINWIPNTLYYIIGRTHKSRAGYHIVAPAITKNDQIIFVNLGWSPKKNVINLQGPVTISGYVRYPYKNVFTPDPIVGKREWGAVLPEQMEVGLPTDAKLIKDFYVELKDPSAYPILQKLVQIPHTIDLPNRHLGYIITWYGLAIAWLMVMIRKSQKIKT